MLLLVCLGQLMLHIFIEEIRSLLLLVKVVVIMFMDLVDLVVDWIYLVELEWAVMVLVMVQVKTRLAPR